MNVELDIKQLPHGEGLPFPRYVTEGAVGADIYSAEDVALAPGETKVVATGFAIGIPDGWEVQFRSRSGLAANKSLTILNAPGTIDPDYTGELKAILHNHGTLGESIKRGDRIGQLVLAPVNRIIWREVGDLKVTTRGEGGMGSTGA